MPNTYELATALAPAFAWLETCEDAHEANPTQESAQALADAQADIDALFDAAPDKAAAVWYMADRYDAEAAFAKAEAKAWSERSKRKADRAAKLRDSLVLLIDQWTETTGEPGIALEGGRVARVRERRSKVVEVFDADALPECWWRVTRAPAKTDISKALKAGEVVPGARLGESITRRAEVK